MDMGKRSIPKTVSYSWFNAFSNPFENPPVPQNKSRILAFTGGDNSLVANSRQPEIMAGVEEARIRKIVHALIKIIAEYRQAQGLTYEDLADKAGIHRTTIGLLDRNERTPTVQIALQLASALGVELSEVLARAEAVASRKGPKTAQSVNERNVQNRHFHNEAALKKLTGLSCACIRTAIQGCYQTLDTIDFQLATHNTPPLAKLVELANISQLI